MPQLRVRVLSLLLRFVQARNKHFPTAPRQQQTGKAEMFSCQASFAHEFLEGKDQRTESAFATPPASCPSRLNSKNHIEHRPSPINLTQGLLYAAIASAHAVLLLRFGQARNKHFPTTPRQQQTGKAETFSCQAPLAREFLEGQGDQRTECGYATPPASCSSVIEHRPSPINLTPESSLCRNCECACCRCCCDWGRHATSTSRQHPGSNKRARPKCSAAKHLSLTSS